MHGSTPPIFPDNPEDWHVPCALLLGKISLERAVGDRNRRRKDENYFFCYPAGTMLDFPVAAAVSYEKLDPITGRTMRDPRILGIVDEEAEDAFAYKRVPGKDLTLAYYKLVRAELPHLWACVRDERIRAHVEGRPRRREF